MPKIRIYEVNYTNTDETFYVTTKLYENAKKYEAVSYTHLSIFEELNFTRC